MHPPQTSRFAAPAASPMTPAQKRAYISARAVGSYVPKLTRKAFEKYGFSAAALLTDWTVIVGEEIAAMAVPERLKWPRSVAIRGDVEAGAEGRPGAVLVLRVNPARALDIEYKGQQLIERINGYFGYRAVAELRLMQAPLDRRTAKPAPVSAISIPAAAAAAASAAPELAAISNDRLRAALARLKCGLEARSRADS
jgi:hypothetical protein